MSLRDWFAGQGSANSAMYTWWLENENWEGDFVDLCYVHANAMLARREKGQSDA